MFGRTLVIFQYWALFLFCSTLLAAAPLEPVSVCEIMHDPGTFEGKTVAVVGRYSFRSTGRWLSEERCKANPKPAEAPPVVWVSIDSKSAPQAPPVLEINDAAVDRKLALIRKETGLRKFRFGSSDYDRWAIVYGRVERQPAGALQTVSAPKEGTPDADTSPVRLLIHGEGVIIFLTEP